MASPTLTSHSFSVFRIDWPAWWQCLLHLLAVFHCFVPFIGCQWGLEYCSRSICWPTKPCVKNSLFIFTPCLPYHFHPIHWDQTTIIVCQSLGSRPTQVQELFNLVPRLFVTTSRCLSVQPVQLLPLRNIWRHISLILAFPPHRYRHSPWPVDVTELFPRFCYWTLIWLSRHWAWLRRGYWRYRRLIDWLIDWLNGMEVMCQAWSADKQVVSHEGFCRSADRSWSLNLNLPVNNEDNAAVEHCASKWWWLHQNMAQSILNM